MTDKGAGAGSGSETADNLREDVAIVGMAGRFPGAPDVFEFWENLRDGVESIRSLSDDELKAAGIDEATRRSPDYVAAGAPLEDADCFDAPFFGYTKREAELMDPQHRLLLECAWAALENAGYDPGSYEGAIGVFAGVAPNTYLQNVLMTRPDILKMAGRYLLLISSEREYAVTRVAFKLNLRGPAISVNTACSTSGVALHLACQSVLSGECDIALVGGARVKAPLTAGYVYEQDGILSPDGHCRAFDAEARGTVVGSGVALVVIKRLSDALRDGDTVHAVVLGTAVNNDGALKVGYTAPSVDGQAAAIVEALQMAGIDAGTVGYVETHGTGTFLGDPIEVAALTRAFRRDTDAVGTCAIGSVKTNIGHLDAGAGMAGVIKTALALRARQIPPSLNFRTPNPQIDFASSPFYVNSTLSEWTSPGAPRRAGVSTFGLGGTNAHIVLEEAPHQEWSSSIRRHHLLLISAKTEEALEHSTSNLSQHLAEQSGIDLADVAHTLHVGRRHFDHRRFVVTDGRADATRVLRDLDPSRVFSARAEPSERQIVFMFPGGGAQYVGMGRDLFNSEQAFRDAIERCAEIVRRRSGWDLLELLYPQDPAVDGAPIERPGTALVALFAVEYALAMVLIAYGVEPEMMIGHSLGEYTAACVSGVLSLHDALAMVARRGELFETLPAGAMLSIPLPEGEVRQLLGTGLSLAVVNKPDLCIVAGEVEEIDRCERMLAERGVDSRRLHISVAAHSHLVEPILDEFVEFAKSINFNPPRIPFASNTTGTWITSAEATDPEYWGRHLRHTVRFVDGLERVLDGPGRILVEVGPGQTLSGFARQHPARRPGLALVAAMRHPTEPIPDDAFFLKALGRLWLAGQTVDFSVSYGSENRRRVPLPSYPFEKRRYWIEPGGPVEAVGPVEAPAESVPANNREDEPLGAQPRNERASRILTEVRTIFHELSGLEIDELDPHATFLELGFDSLFMTQATGAVGRRYGVRVSFRQLFEEAPTLNALARHLDEQLPEDPSLQPAFPTELLERPGSIGEHLPGGGGPLSGGVSPAVQNLIEQQLEIMRQQLVALQGAAAGPPLESPQIAPESQEPSLSFRAEMREGVESPTGPWRPIARQREGLDTRQQVHIERLRERLTSRSPGSKQITQANRARLADPRTVAGFRLPWKEIVYPVVATRSAGSKLWDVDGNEYLDVAMGFGVNLFGHSPRFVIDAVTEQLARGIEIGPQTPLAGEVAGLISELTGHQRVAFCNTGSEAVLAALRLARTVTGRNRVVTFANDYHGLFDEVLARGINVGAERRSVPIAPGIPAHMSQELTILDYGDPESLDIIAGLASELAAVLVEPVQSRHPDLQPKEFLQNLRRITAEFGVPLIFDEMITGFRSHPGGVQALFDVRADLATYGKVIGGGFPIGVVAGSSEYMDALDGGMWQYGDASIPEADVTWFAGTFVRHPVALAASRAALLHMKEQGPALQQELNARTADLVNELNGFFGDRDLPIWVETFSSMFLPTFQSKQEYASLLYFHLRDQGIHITEGRSAFLSTAHTSSDIEQLLTAFQTAVVEMNDAGFFTGQRSSARSTDRAAGHTQMIETPLTDGQQEIWLGCQLGDEANASFNLSSTLDLTGPVDVDALGSAIQGVIARHDALRATFSAAGDVQHVAPELRIEVPLEDLSTLEAAARESELARLRAAEVEAPFDLTSGPLVRAKLIRLGPDEHLLFLTVHHIVCDGWSAGLLSHDLAALYTATVRGEKAELEPPMQYGEYLAWQAEHRRSEAWQADEAFWKQALESPYPISDFPPDRARPARRTYRADRRTITMPATLVERLRRVATRHNGTLFAALMATFEIYLSRVAGEPEVALGVSIAGQTQFGGRQLVGHCVNVLPLRRRVDGDAHFGDHLASAQRAFLDAYEHQNYGYGMIVGNLVRGRDASRPPLMTVTLNMDAPGLPPVFEGLVTRTGSNPRHFELFDVFVNLVPRGEEIDIECTFNLDLFDHSTILRRLEGFMVLAESIANGADSPIAELPILTEAERDLLREWNETGVQYSGPFVLHDLFERRVGERPEDVAVVFRDEALTYGELNGRANRLARLLVGRGVGSGSLVGVLMERSVEMVVCLLAVLKAGAGYVPLDPEYPVERLEYMVAETGMPLVLTVDGQPVPGLPSGVGVVKVDSEWGLAARLSDANLEVPIGPEDVAYVIYTSGSTGRPKGVINTHSGISNLLRWMHDLYGMGPDDCLLQRTPFSFDPSVGEVFWPLSFGARLVLAEPGGHRDPAHIVDLIRRHQITKVQFVPSNLGPFLNHPEVGECTSLRTVLCGGEPLTGDLQDLFFDRLDAELHNVYGPTEAAIQVTCWKCEPDRRYPMIPIGRAAPNTQIHILDDRLAPVPIGVVGELHIGGAQVARGYVNRPDLTAERFIPDPFSTVPGARLYKTGDLARFMADGNIEFLGRRDHQVKIRGFRIELGEIEATLIQHPSIANAAAVVSGAARSDERIFAYVTTRDGAVDEAAVRDFLKRKLPRYMVPARVVVIERIPLTTSGKIDRNALPLPERSGEHVGSAHVAPRTPLEQDIAAVWSEVLGVDDIGVHDDIFDLGGHSLDAMRVNARLSEMLQVDLSLLVFFENPTIEGQALAATRAMASQLLGEDELEAMVADLGAGVERPEGRMAP